MKDIEPDELAQSVENPWIANAGIFVDDPTWDDFLQSMADYRSQLDEEQNDAEMAESLTIYLSTRSKNILRAEALASQKSMSALLREWIAERLDLPETA